MGAGLAAPLPVDLGYPGIRGKEQADCHIIVRQHGQDGGPGKLAEIGNHAPFPVVNTDIKVHRGWERLLTLAPSLS